MFQEDLEAELSMQTSREDLGGLLQKDLGFVESEAALAWVQVFDGYGQAVPKGSPLSAP